MKMRGKTTCEKLRVVRIQERKRERKTPNEKSERKEQREDQRECYVRSQSTSSQGDDDWR